MDFATHIMSHSSAVLCVNAFSIAFGFCRVLILYASWKAALQQDSAMEFDKMPSDASDDSVVLAQGIVGCFKRRTRSTSSKGITAYYIHSQITQWLGS